MEKKRPLAELFLTFFKIGLFTFGGGYAMISLIEDCCVEKKHWITHEEMMDITVIAESTPGPIAINCATFVGHRQAGVAGAAAATAGVVLPSLVIILLIEMVLEQFLSVPMVANAFRGIKVAVGVLILGAAVNMFRKMKKTPLSLGIFWTAFGLMLLSQLLGWGISSLMLMIAAGTFSLGLHGFRQKGGGV